MRVPVTPTTAPGGLQAAEQVILEQLRERGRCTVDELLERVHELTWSQLFLAMDLLSRRGEIELAREGFTYSLRMRPGLESREPRCGGAY